MKIRQGFVSNSSSSSFICSICNYTESGRDADLTDFEMFRCENGHTLHESCIEKISGKEKLKNKDEAYETYLPAALEEYRNKYYEGEDETFQKEKEELASDFENEYAHQVPEECCPICKFLLLTDEDELLLRRKESKYHKDELLTNARSQFKSYEEFKKYLVSE